MYSVCAVSEQTNDVSLFSCRLHASCTQAAPYTVHTTQQREGRRQRAEEQKRDMTSETARARCDGETGCDRGCMAVKRWDEQRLEAGGVRLIG